MNKYFYPALAVLLLLFPVAIQAQSITEADIREHIAILASDEFEGRKPGTAGENKTVEYIASEWAKAGLVPATGSSSWYTTVALIERATQTQMIRFTRTNGKRSANVPTNRDAIVLRSAKQFGDLTNAQAVYAGYGNGNVEDLRQVVDGKLVFIQLSPSEADDDDDFPDYSSRKEALIAAGAVGVITIVEGKNRWRGLVRRYRRDGTTLAGGEYHANVEGLITEKQFRKLMKKLGMDQLVSDGLPKDFSPKLLPLFADLSVKTLIRSYTSHNVVGKITGSLPDAGAVLFLGHWDHFGECRVRDEENPEADRICNGAVDNASGISLLIETAKRLASGPQPQRDIYFLATTAEEKGLLGARAFAAEPPFPLDRLVAVFNADTVALAPTGKLLAVVGRGKAELDSDIEKIALAEGREIDMTDSANAYLRRQDGYVFLQKGIPAYMITSAFSDQERLDAYLAGPYHDVTDEVGDELLLGGAADDANFHVALGRYFGSTETYPEKVTSD